MAGTQDLNARPHKNIGHYRYKKPIVGAGLVLSRYRGERVIIKADERASDEEILDAIRNEGIIITMVDIDEHRPNKQRSGRKLAKIGIRASNHLSIAREEIINRDQSEQDDLDGNLQAKDGSDATR